MPVPTTELGLLKGVDADDTADYLVTSLANSLTTVDSLFNNVSGHTHGGAHQGGPIASASIGNAQLGPDVARANQLVNGGFEIWQRGVGAFTANGAWTADRWSIGLVGTDTLSVNYNTASSDARSNACAACVFTLGTGAGSTVLSQKLGANESQLKNGQLTFSARVNVATANAVRLGMYDGSAWTYGAFNPGGGGYQTLSVTATMTNATADRWVGVYFAASCTAYIDNAMLVVGSQAANYVPLHPADDLARCLRYYQVIGNQVAAYPIYCNYAPAGAPAFCLQPYFTKVATTPTVTKNGTWQTSNCGQPSITGIMTEGCNVSLTATAAGQCYVNPAGAGCTITIEANP